MEIQKNIAFMLKRTYIGYRNLTEFAEALGIGHTTLYNLMAGRGNPNADTIELVAKGLNVSVAQLVSGELDTVDRAFNIISGMVDSLHPIIQKSAAIQLDGLRQFFLLSEDQYAQDGCWRYTVTGPYAFHYAIKGTKMTPRGRLIKTAESKTFTNDPRVAKDAAELFTRNALSPIHLEEAIEDFMGGL